jgi:hypothetical protein
MSPRVLQRILSKCSSHSPLSPGLMLTCGSISHAQDHRRHSPSSINISRRTFARSLRHPPQHRWFSAGKQGIKKQKEAKGAKDAGSHQGGRSEAKAGKEQREEMFQLLLKMLKKKSDYQAYEQALDISKQLFGDEAPVRVCPKSLLTEAVNHLEKSSLVFKAIVECCRPEDLNFVRRTEQHVSTV